MLKSKSVELNDWLIRYLHKQLNRWIGHQVAFLSQLQRVPAAGIEPATFHVSTECVKSKRKVNGVPGSILCSVKLMLY